MFRGVAFVMSYKVRRLSRANISIVSYFFFSLGQIPKYSKSVDKYILSCMQKVYDAIFSFSNTIFVKYCENSAEV